VSDVRSMTSKIGGDMRNKNNTGCRRLLRDDLAMPGKSQQSPETFGKG